MRLVNCDHSREAKAVGRPPFPRISLRPQANHTTSEGVTYKIAEDFSERCAAFHLTYTAYAQQGLITPNVLGMRLSVRQLLPDSAVFIACRQNRIICTLSLICGRGMGLLLEQEFGSEVDELRAHSGTLAEVTSLAALRQGESPKRTSRVLTNLFRLAHAYARFNHLEHLLIAVHPRHSRFYQRFLGFRELGAQRSCHRVLGNPAVACIHDVKRFNEKKCPLGLRLPELTFEPWELENRTIPGGELEYFAAAWGALNLTGRAA